MPIVKGLNSILDNAEYKERYGFKTNAKYQSFEKGLSESVVRKISKLKGEPDWMLRKRLAGYKAFKDKRMPKWGPDLSAIDWDAIEYYKMPNAKEANRWEDVPKEIKDTFEKLGVPESERKFFSGVEAQFDSGVVYAKAKEMLEKQGVIFEDTDTAVKKHPDLVRKYFGTVIASDDNKFAALNAACWSGGSFVYVPKGVKVVMPLNAYFRINSGRFGQFERTLIIADEGSEVTFLEGCTALIYSDDSLHIGVVELIAHKDAHIRYVTVQNWSRNIINLTTQRAIAHENAHVEWIDTNIGSKINVKYPCVVLKGANSKGEIISTALAGDGQIQDSGGKAIHLAANTTSRIVSKSVSKGSGVASFRGLVHIGKDAANAKASVVCNALLVDETAKTNTYPYIVTQRNDALVSHEAKVGRVSDEELFYLMSRGISESDATAMVILGFLSDLTKVLPMEYSLELKRLIQLDLTPKVR